MALSSNQIHDNLVTLTSRLGGVPQDEIHDNLSGIAELAGNEGEAAAADMIQTLSFTTWIRDICDGYKQEKELDVGTPDYNENANTIRADIKNINNLGHELGIKEDVIPTPKPGQETTAAAQAIYSNFALPYEVGAEVDYAKYMQVQEGKNQMSRAMKRLSASLAQSPQYGTHAKNFWNAQTKAANQYNALAGEFLDGMESLDNYTKEISDAKNFLLKEEKNSKTGISDVQMGDFDKADKIDFENDDAGLQSELRGSIQKAEKLVKTERAMLKAGHVDSKRRNLFENTLKGYMAEIKTGKSKIESDDLADMKATAEVEQEMTIHPERVPEEHEKLYMDMVEKQKNDAPTFTGEDLKDCAKLAKLGMEAMNISLIATGVTPMSTSMKMVQFAQMGKFIYDVNKFIKEESGVKKSSSKEASFDMEPEYKGHKEKKDDEPEIQEEEPINQKFTLAVKKKAADFAERMRTAVREGMLQFDQNAPDYEANEEFNEKVELLVGDVIDTNGKVISESPDTQSANQSRTLIALSNIIKRGTGYDVFDKDPQDMSEDELNVYSSAVIAVMAPMKDSEGKYLPNFKDCYAVGEETLPEAQQEYTEAARSLMIVGQPDAALAVRESQTELIDLSQQYQDFDNDDLTHVEDSGKYEEIQEKAAKEDDKMRDIMKVYKPLCTKAGLMIGSSLYQKHEFNKAWKETIHQRNLKLMCEGTMMAMEKSQRENEQLAHEALYGPHGLLHA